MVVVDKPQLVYNITFTQNRKQLSKSTHGQDPISEVWGNPPSYKTGDWHFNTLYYLKLDFKTFLILRCFPASLWHFCRVSGLFSLSFSLVSCFLAFWSGCHPPPWWCDVKWMLCVLYQLDCLLVTWDTLIVDYNLSSLYRKWKCLDNLYPYKLYIMVFFS